MPGPPSPIPPVPDSQGHPALQPCQPFSHAANPANASVTPQIHAPRYFKVLPRSHSSIRFPVYLLTSNLKAPFSLSHTHSLTHCPWFTEASSSPPRPPTFHMLQVFLHQVVPIGISL